MTNKKTSQQANNVNESLGKKTHNFPRQFSLENFWAVGIGRDLSNSKEY